MINTGEVVSFSKSTRSGGIYAVVAVCLAGSFAGTVEAVAEQQPSYQPLSLQQQQSFAPPATTVDCATVRYNVAEHGKAKSIAWAVKNGYSWAQINQARRCLKG
ncbi:hypothetical protein RPB_2013 [Rhodopseudomonas palustris HaA2]|uniref:Uncharacterized protein n=1 Tax=Rhodopseudomonas palustris (strain HaA2) TaxID=316058 RepID=Q2IYI9_RHOP2|nr:hypothetical protein [Rhodopseudomonas palustris]ABD06721.1 hypothetical protein RPB_2013 [Rhodopseudomonas palustris HaA2]